MECNIGERKVIGGKKMKCVDERTHGRVYREGCYWVYSEEDPYNHTEISESDLEYYESVAEHNAKMEQCVINGGYWLGNSCYFSGEDVHPPITPQISKDDDKDDEEVVRNKTVGESCGGGISWLRHGIKGGRECAEGLECINGRCQEKTVGATLLKGAKSSLWLILVVGILIVALLFGLGHSGLGGAAGKVAEARV